MTEEDIRDPSSLKTYIAVRDDVPDDLVPLIVAHAILSANEVWGYDQFLGLAPHHAKAREHAAMWQLWKRHSFKKVVVRVTPEEFDFIESYFNTVACYEENVLGADDCVTVVLPLWKDEDRERARYLRELPLWAVKRFVWKAHDFWGAGESDCPREIKASNGELHTLRCKVCGQDNPRKDYCEGQ
jgi:hypothetical protein